MQPEPAVAPGSSWPDAGPVTLSPPDRPPDRLQLLGRFELIVGGRPEQLGTGCRRLLAALALRTGHAGRREVAGLLWPDVAAARATANLRSVLWRVPRRCHELVETGTNDLRLAPRLVVDLHAAVAIARRLIDRSVTMDADALSLALSSNFRDDLLPEMSDEEWLSAEVERFRQLRLHAMESLSERLTQVGWFGAAVDVALSAMSVDPFRESAHRALMAAYLAEGNRLAARRHYSTYRDMLRREMGLEPSARLSNLLEVG